MSIFEEPRRLGKWHCGKCNTWCMNEYEKCSFCSGFKPLPKTPPPPPAIPKEEPEVIVTPNVAKSEVSKEDIIEKICDVQPMAGNLLKRCFKFKGDETKAMDDFIDAIDKNNQLRCTASEIIVTLYRDKEIEQLKLLQMHVNSALNELDTNAQ